MSCSLQEKRYLMETDLTEMSTVIKFSQKSNDQRNICPVLKILHLFLEHAYDKNGSNGPAFL